MKIRSFKKGAWSCQLNWYGQDGDQLEIESYLDLNNTRVVKVNLTGYGDMIFQFTAADWPLGLAFEDREAIVSFCDKVIMALSSFAGVGISKRKEEKDP